ncbi:11097_t:CDS:2 [Acaulospora morrowiae]|uniref:11097_t:CDS:1 n=1 Tax=Acaulospora morrowiae TaxID=94023 RepID=A0A9N9BFY1_9GLOM|nr:11097_t:CDS:2 [Acaulospora morrowiae]
MKLQAVFFITLFFSTFVVSITYPHKQLFSCSYIRDSCQSSICWGEASSLKGLAHRSHPYCKVVIKDHSGIVCDEKVSAHSCKEVTDYFTRGNELFAEIKCYQDNQCIGECWLKATK